MKETTIREQEIHLIKKEAEKTVERSQTKGTMRWGGNVMLESSQIMNSE